MDGSPKFSDESDRLTKPNVGLRSATLTMPRPNLRQILTMAQRWGTGLSGRLLVWVVLFVLAVELLIFVPSLTRFRHDWLTQRAREVDLALVAMNSDPLSSAEPRLPDVSGQRTGMAILDRIGARAVALIADDERVLVLGTDSMPVSLVQADLRSRAWWKSCWAALNALAAAPGRDVRILANASFRPDTTIEVVMNEGPLKSALWAHAGNVFWSGLIVALLTGAMLFALLVWWFVLPIQRLTCYIEQFRNRPEDQSQAIPASGRLDEIGRAETALHDMQSTVRQALHSRERLAALGLGVAKINHDLRNSLSAASILTEALAQRSEAGIAPIAARLERTIERAIALATSVLAFGKADGPQARLGIHALAPILDEALAEALAPFPSLKSAIDGDRTLFAQVDPDLTHRALVNLIRNAAQALGALDTQDPAAPPPLRLRIDPPLNSHDQADPDTFCIRIEDRGPGLPKAVQAQLFAPFAGGKAGGTGLGLSIAREAARAQGGDLLLVSTGADGTVFALYLRRAPGFE